MTHKLAFKVDLTKIQYDGELIGPFGYEPSHKTGLSDVQLRNLFSGLFDSKRMFYITDFLVERDENGKCQINLFFENTSAFEQGSGQNKSNIVLNTHQHLVSADKVDLKQLYENAARKLEHSSAAQNLKNNLFPTLFNEKDLRHRIFKTLHDMEEEYITYDDLVRRVKSTPGSGMINATLKLMREITVNNKPLIEISGRGNQKKISYIGPKFW